jgi:hypothetical protein
VGGFQTVWSALVRGTDSGTPPTTSDERTVTMYIGLGTLILLIIILILIFG